MPDFDNIMEFPDLIKRLNELTTNINKKQTEIENLLKEKLHLLDKISEKEQQNIKNSILINDLKNKYKDLEKKYKNLEYENMNLENTTNIFHLLIDINKELFQQMQLKTYVYKIYLLFLAKNTLNNLHFLKVNHHFVIEL